MKDFARLIPSACDFLRTETHEETGDLAPVRPNTAIRTGHFIERHAPGAKAQLVAKQRRATWIRKCHVGCGHAAIRLWSTP